MEFKITLKIDPLYKSISIIIYNDSYRFEHNDDKYINFYLKNDFSIYGEDAYIYIICKNLRNYLNLNIKEKSKIDILKSEEELKFEEYDNKRLEEIKNKNNR